MWFSAQSWWLYGELKQTNTSQYGKIKGTNFVETYQLGSKFFWDRFSPCKCCCILLMQESQSKKQLSDHILVLNTSEVTMHCPKNYLAFTTFEIISMLKSILRMTWRVDIFGNKRWLCGIGQPARWVLIDIFTALFCSLLK